MATLRGLYGLVKVGANDLAECTQWTMSRSAEEEDTSIINATAKRTETGAIEASGTISCYYDDTDTNGQVALESAFDGNTAVTLELYTDADATGTVYYSMSAVITSLDVDNGGATGRVTATFNYKNTTAVTRSTVA